MKAKKIISLLLVLMIALVLTIGCADNKGGEGSEKSDSQIPPVITVGASSPGGSLYLMGGAIANLLASDSGFPSSVQITGGSRHNAELLNEGEITLGLSAHSDIRQLWADGKTNIRSLVPLAVSQHHYVVRADTPIHTLSDLEGKPFSMQTSGSAHDEVGRLMFNILGIKPDFVNVDRSDTVSMTRDNLLVGFFFASGYPVVSVLDLGSTHKVRLLGYTDEEMDTILAKEDWLMPGVIPAGTYEGIDEDIQ